MVVIVFGLPGTGKSYFASRLAELINAKYISSDRLRKELFPKRTYSNKEKQMVYKEMLAQTNMAVNEGANVVLDATFHKKDIRQKLVKELKIRSEIFFIEITANENLIRDRLKKERPYSEADFEVYKLIQREWEFPDQPHLTLNSTDNNIESLLQKAIDHLKAQNDKRPNQ